MLGLLQISDAVLGAPACDILYDIALEVTDAVGVDVLHWLDRIVFIMIAVILFVQ
jgi:hypothetical protein